jgi:hypothetical protein
MWIPEQELRDFALDAALLVLVVSGRERVMRERCGSGEHRPNNQRLE